MERRVLLAVVLSFLVLYAYQALFVPPPPAGREPTSAAAPSEGLGGPDGAARESAAGAVAVEAPAQALPEAPQAQALVSEPTERQIIVETATLEATFSNQGARVVHWRLKDYRDETGAPLDLVPSDLPASRPSPFALRVDDPTLNRRLNAAIYRVVGADANGRLDARATAATLSFEYEDAEGLRLRKDFRFEPGGYVVGFSALGSAGGNALNPTVQWGPGLGDIGATAGGGSFFTGNYVQPPQAIYHRDGEVERITPDNLAGQSIHEGRFRFGGIDDHYFLAVAIDPGQAKLEFTPVTLPGEGGTQRQLLEQSFQFPAAPQNVRFFFGPKQFDLLRSVDAELVRAINFGFFAWLAVPLLGALTSIYDVVGNYGWAIIILTVLINLVIFPLRHKSVVSMRRMQMLQPQLKAIQERYAGLKVTDPARQKMNTEIMNLYRERGVNPASGCVPMLLTLPVLFAFYSLLSQAIELRGAAFGLWIRDLSQHDPYYVTPVLMGLSMFYQQKITPTTADPAQQRIMMIMPLMFGFMFLWAPSGLVIYWFVSNLWAIGQQHFTNWWIGPAPVQNVRPPAERRLKNVGGGRTSDAGKQP
jgi:YidC/Oxa1 family membrane protein insertase